jgi:hypothetical protein
MFVAVADMTVFQVLKEKKSVLELVAEDHCQDFTPL